VEIAEERLTIARRCQCRFGETNVRTPGTAAEFPFIKRESAKSETRSRPVHDPFMDKEQLARKLAASLSLSELQKLLGHANSKTSADYLH
jgi:hypothetical protein